MLFIETAKFSALADELFGDDELIGLQWHLMAQPDAGDVIVGSGGVRKVRWRIGSRGKRGGVRVIYYWKVSDDEIWLLTVYPKNERATIPAHVLREIASEIDDD